MQLWNWIPEAAPDHGLVPLASWRVSRHVVGRTTGQAIDIDMRTRVRRVLVHFWSRTMSQLHVRLYQATRGRLGARRLRNRILLLETVGHRTSRPHTVPLAYARVGDGFVVAAGNVAFGRIPHWLLNVRSNGQVRVTVRNEVVPMLAHEAESSEREQLWAYVARGIRGIEFMQRRIGRLVPVVVLSPTRSPG